MRHPRAFPCKCREICVHQYGISVSGLREDRIALVPPFLSSPSALCVDCTIWSPSPCGNRTGISNAGGPGSQFMPLAQIDRLKRPGLGSRWMERGGSSTMSSLSASGGPSTMNAPNYMPGRRTYRPRCRRPLDHVLQPPPPTAAARHGLLQHEQQAQALIQRGRKTVQGQGDILNAALA